MPNRNIYPTQETDITKINLEHGGDYELVLKYPSIYGPITVAEENLLESLTGWHNVGGSRINIYGWDVDDYRNPNLLEYNYVYIYFTAESPQLALVIVAVLGIIGAGIFTWLSLKELNKIEHTTGGTLLTIGIVTLIIVAIYFVFRNKTKLKI